MKAVSLASVVLSVGTVGIVVELLARLLRTTYGASTRRSDDGPHGPFAPAIRRIRLVSPIACSAGLLAALLSRNRGPWLAAAALGPLVPLAWVVTEIALAIGKAGLPDVPSRFAVPLGGRSTAASYVSPPLQGAHCAVLLVTMSTFAWLAGRLPPRIPLHWNQSGAVDGWGSPMALLFFPGLMFFAYALHWILITGIARERWALPPREQDRYADLQLRRRTSLARLVQVTTLGLNLSLASICLSVAAGALPGHGALVPSGVFAGLCVPALSIVVPLLVWIPPLARVQREIHSLAGSNVLGTHPSGWRLRGVVYFAHDDPAVFVPKRVGIGLTLNFARPAAWLLLLGMGAAPVLVGVMAIEFGTSSREGVGAAVESRNALAIGKLARMEGPIELAIAAPVELDFLSKAQVIQEREEAIRLHPELVLDPYHPSPPVFGQIEDGIPWWGIVGRYVHGAGDRSMEGPSVQSQYLLNPLLLVAADFWDAGDPLEWNPRMGVEEIAWRPEVPFYPRARDLRWRPAESRAEVTYEVSRYLADSEAWILPPRRPRELRVDLVAYNARDMGLPYAYVSLDGSQGIEQPSHSPRPFEIRQFLHRGGSCGYPGGCNNMSPRVEALDAIEIRDLPARIQVVLWAREPASVTDPPDMVFPLFLE